MSSEDRVRARCGAPGCPTRADAPAGSRCDPCEGIGIASGCGLHDAVATQQPQGPGRITLAIRHVQARLASKPVKSEA